MLEETTTLAERRRRFRARLAGGGPVLVPLCLDPLAARLCEQLGYEAGYVSGGALGFSLAISEALLTVGELAAATAAIVRRSDLPVIVDGGVGFGDPVHATRMIWEFEAAGAVAVEIEDQVAPKRVSHHRGVEHLVAPEAMVAKIRFAAAARRDPNLLLIARTGAVRHEGVEAAIERGRAYIEAGADALMLVPTGDEAEWARLREAFSVPLATIDVIGRRPPAEWGELGFALVIDAMTGQVVSYRALREAYAGQREPGAPGVPLDQIGALYRELGDVAGFEELYAIERATTEPGT